MEVVATQTLREEAIDLLQELIRLDTVNPPGNETAAAELLRGYLEANGVRCELHARVPGRANLVARRPGRGCCSSRTRTPSSPIPASGRSIRGRASCGTGRSGGVAHST